ncbi:LacI-type transcriptional regulator [Microbacterium sp. HM58-2]|nr:LacI-type transcriptional regulator [Microbacterium sp. HM58-2]
MTNDRTVTLRDVAAVSGVSVPTVSKVLNGGGRVSPATRARILEAAERLDFRPNALAQFFALGRSFSVGVIAQKASGIFSMPVITGIVHELSDHDVATIIYDDENDASLRAENVRKLRARRVDGVLIVGDGTDTPVASISHSLSAPVVHAFAVPDNPRDISFLPDDRKAGRLAGAHLIEQGRTRIAHVTADSGFRTVRERHQGLLSALDDSGLKLSLGQPLFGTWSRSWGFEAASVLSDRLGEIDAVFCGNDFIAQGLIRRLTSLGVSVPDDIAVVGYDNWSHFSGDEDHYLTSVDPHHADLGRQAARELILSLEGPREGGVRLTACSLVPGFSSGARPAPEGGDFPFL